MSFAKIYAIDDVDVTLLKSNPPSLLVAAAGRVLTSGWSNGQLSLYVYLVPPSDGVQEFDFIAERPAPGSIVLEVLTPIRAETTIENVDVANYWGPGNPLRGVRVCAVSNCKTALFDDPTKIHALGTRAAAAAAVIHAPDTAANPSFATDIKPLFRKKDVSIMKAVTGWSLDVYAEVKPNAAKVLDRLRDGSMPCDGAWPVADIDLFQKWTQTGMQP